MPKVRLPWSPTISVDRLAWVYAPGNSFFSFLSHAAAFVRQIFAVLQLIRIFGFTSALIRSATQSSNARPGPCNES